MAAIGLLNDVLGGGPHSSLFRAIRLEHKLAYQVGSLMMNYSECGMLVAHALVPRKVVRPVLGMLLTEFQRLSTQGMPRDTFEDARVRLMQRFEMLEEEWGALATFLANEYRGEADSPTPQFFLRQLESLDFDAFNKIARELLARENRVVVLWGRIDAFAKWRIKRLIRSQ
jgi:predicted Zn-dependent peptidase